jgi:hypothetical protein
MSCWRRGEVEAKMMGGKVSILQFGVFSLPLAALHLPFWAFFAQNAMSE